MPVLATGLRRASCPAAIFERSEESPADESSKACEKPFVGIASIISAVRFSTTHTL